MNYSATMVAKSPTKTTWCSSCNKAVTPSPAPKEKSDKRKRSSDQEKRAAKRHGAKVVAGSGASPLSKGDIHKRGKIRGECKYTDAASYSLKLDELRKLEREAKIDEDPIFEIEFQGVSPFRRYYVIPDYTWEKMEGYRLNFNAIAEQRDDLFELLKKLDGVLDLGVWPPSSTGLVSNIRQRGGIDDQETAYQRLVNIAKKFGGKAKAKEPR